MRRPPARRRHLRSSKFDPGTLPSLVRSLRGDDLLIAIARPPANRTRRWRSGSPGRGFDGNLTSDSTRTDGYVLSTDVAPTILERFGIAIPSQMSGQPIRSEGSVDPAAIESLGARMAMISERRGPVIGFSLLAWLRAARAGGRRQPRAAGAAGGAAGRARRRLPAAGRSWPARRSNRGRASKRCW